MIITVHFFKIQKIGMEQNSQEKQGFIKWLT